MNFNPLLILWILFYGSFSWAVSPDVHCFNGDLRTARLDIGDLGVTIQNRFLNEGNTELEQYYVDLLELKTSSDLSVNRVTITLPAADVKCERTSSTGIGCKGETRAAWLDVAGNYTKDGTLVALSGQTQVSAKILSMVTWLRPDLTSDAELYTLNVQARLEVSFSDGKKMTLVWAPYFSAAADLTRSSYCLGL